jgi:hypothetical protein
MVLSLAGDQVAFVVFGASTWPQGRKPVKESLRRVHS